MSTIGDLCVTSSVSPDDKLPIWQNTNGVTRALPISVLDGRYLTQADVALLAASATVERFIAGVNFTPGVSIALTLANQYFSTSNIEVFFDAAFQGPDQFTLFGLGLLFSSPIPVGVQSVYVRGGAARLIGVPSNGTVGPNQLAYPTSGTTAQRPVPLFVGQPYFDTTLLLPIFASQITPTIIWVNSAGVAV